MVTDSSGGLFLASLDPLTGTYASERLTIEVQSLGYGAGLQVIWKWGGLNRDVGLIGTIGEGCLGLGYLSNSQPWWGTGFLRWFNQEEVALAGDRAHLRFKWVATEQPSTEVERISLEFSGGALLTFTYEMDGSKLTRRRWELVRST